MTASAAKTDFKISQLVAKGGTIRSSMKTLLEEVRRYGDEVNEVGRSLQEATKKIAQQEDQISVLVSQNQTLEDQIASFKKMHHNEFQRLLSQEDLENFKTQLDDFQKQLEEQQKALDQREDYLLEKEEDIEVKKMRKRLQARQDDLTALREKHAQEKELWSQERARLADEKRNLVQALIARGNEVASLNKLYQVKLEGAGISDEVYMALGMCLELFDYYDATYNVPVPLPEEQLELKRKYINRVLAKLSGADPEKTPPAPSEPAPAETSPTEASPQPAPDAA